MLKDSKRSGLVHGKVPPICVYQLIYGARVTSIGEQERSAKVKQPEEGEAGDIVELNYGNDGCGVPSLCSLLPHECQTSPHRSSCAIEY